MLKLHELSPSAIAAHDEVSLIHRHECLRLQKQIVDAAKQRTYYTYRNLVFLCWLKARVFSFGGLDSGGLRLVLSAVEAEEKVPHFTEEMERMICNCGALNGAARRHAPKCKVHQFRAAIEE